MKTISGLDNLIAEIEEIRPDVVIIYGTSASGKTTISEAITKALESKGYSVPKINNKPTPLSVDSFYRNNTKEIAKNLGENFDNPMLIDHKEAAEKIDELLKEGKTKIPIYSFKDSKRVGEQVIEIENGGNRIVVVEGIYAFALEHYLKEKGYRTLTIEVVPPSPLELIIRRIVRDIERKGISDPVKQMELSMKALATNQVYKNTPPNIVYVNDWSILEKVGEETYQIKVPKEKIREMLNNLQPKKVYFEDLVIRYGNEQLRLRIFWDKERPNPESAELSYRRREGETVKSWKIKVDPSVYSEFIMLSYILLGRPPERYPRDITALREVNLYKMNINGKEVTIKEYGDRDYAEIETSDKDILETIKKSIKEYSTRSYYDS